MNNSLVKKIALCTLLAIFPAGKAKAFDNVKFISTASLAAIGLGDGIYNFYKGSSLQKIATLLTGAVYGGLVYWVSYDAKAKSVKNVAELIGPCLFPPALNGLCILSDQACKGAVKLYEKATVKAVDNFDDDDDE